MFSFYRSISASGTDGCVAPFDCCKMSSGTEMRPSPNRLLRAKWVWEKPEFKLFLRIRNARIRSLGRPRMVRSRTSVTRSFRVLVIVPLIITGVATVCAAVPLIFFSSLTVFSIALKISDHHYGESVSQAGNQCCWAIRNATTLVLRVPAIGCSNIFNSSVFNSAFPQACNRCAELFPECHDRRSCECRRWGRSKIFNSSVLNSRFSKRATARCGTISGIHDRRSGESPRRSAARHSIHQV